MPAIKTACRSAPAVLLGLAGLLSVHESGAQQRNVSTVQRGEDEAAVKRSDGAEVQRRVLQDVQQREQQALQHAPVALPPSVPPVSSGAAANSASDVDDRPLWNLLRAKKLVQFDWTLAAFRQRYPHWSPAAGMLAERERQQQDIDIDSAFARSDADVVEQLMRKYPAQFSCARIDRLWRAAEILAKAGRKEQALALYRSVFPDCQPARNRIATLYMAQKNIGGDSEGLAQLIALEAQSGRRDADSEKTFAKLQYDRDASRLAALPPESDESLRLARQMAPRIDANRDSGAATLSGWIMLAHGDRGSAESWFLRAQDWSPASVEPKLGELQIRLDSGDIAGAEALLKQPQVAADPRSKAQSARLSMLRAWNFYNHGQYEQSSPLFAAQYRDAHDIASAEGWALSESARGRLPELRAASEAQSPPLQDYAAALQSQQLYYRKQFLAAYVLQRQTEQSVQRQIADDPVSGKALQRGTQSYLPKNLNGIDAASVTAGFVLSNHAGTLGEGHLETLAPSARAEWIDGTRQYNLRYRRLMLDAGTLSVSSVAQAIGAPASYRASGKVNGDELWFAVGDSLRLTGLGSLDWQASLGATDGGAGGTDLHGQFSAGRQARWGGWTAYAGSNPVRDSLLSWRGMRFPGSGQVWGDVRRNSVGAKTLWQATPDWSISANADLSQFSGQNVQSNKAASLDLGAGYNLKPAGFDYFTLGPALHYLHYDNNQNRYDWGLGGYYSPQRSVSGGIASQFLTLEGNGRQWSGNLELGWNSAGESASSCLPVAFGAVDRSAVNCGYAGSRDSGMYSHLQVGVVQRVGMRWQIGALGDLNVTPGRDRQYAAMLFVRYLFSDRDAVFSRDLPKNTRDFYGQLDDGR